MATEKSFQPDLHSMNSTVSLLGIPISRCGMDQVVAKVEARIATQTHPQIEDTPPGANTPKGYVSFVNVHTLTESQYNSALHSALNRGWLNVADGVPLVWYSKLKKRPILSRVCGPDFMTRFLERNSKLDFGFIGGAPGCAEQIIQRFGLRGVSYSTPVRSFSETNAREDWMEFLKRCPEGKAPPAVWVGLGAPKQELWMSVVSALAPQTLFFGVGAAFDFLTSRKKRAPVWVQKLGLEWAYRLLSEPQRLWRRYLVTNTLFIHYVVRDMVLHSFKIQKP